MISKKLKQLSFILILLMVCLVMSFPQTILADEIAEHEQNNLLILTPRAGGDYYAEANVDVFANNQSNKIATIYIRSDLVLVKQETYSYKYAVKVFCKIIPETERGSDIFRIDNAEITINISSDAFWKGNVFVAPGQTSVTVEHNGAEASLEIGLAATKSATVTTMNKYVTLFTYSENHANDQTAVFGVMTLFEAKAGAAPIVSIDLSRLEITGLSFAPNLEVSDDNIGMAFACDNPIINREVNVNSLNATPTNDFFEMTSVTSNLPHKFGYFFAD